MKKYLTLSLLLLSVNLYSQNIDIRLLREINLNRNKQLDNTFRFITNSAAPVAISTPIVLLGVSIIKRDSTMLRKSIYIGATVLSAAVITTTLKHSINRTRPFITYPYIEKETSGGSPSFPSGHTSDVFSLATSVSLAYPKWYVIVPVYTWAGAIGYSRMSLGVHYPSDVLVGAIIGAGSAYLCFKGQQWLNKKR